MATGALEDEIRMYSNKQAELDNIRDYTQHEYINAVETYNPPFETGLIYDYTKSTPELTLMPTKEGVGFGYIEGSAKDCMYQAQKLYSQIKFLDRLRIERGEISDTPGYTLNVFNEKEKNSCEPSDKCYIGAFNRNDNVKNVEILSYNSCDIQGYLNVEIYCSFRPSATGKWTISSQGINGAQRFHLWILKDNAIYDHLYSNADIKELNSSISLNLSKNYYYTLRIQVSGQLAPFNFASLFTFSGGKIEKPENMFRLLLNPDKKSVYKPKLLYYGLVKQRGTKKYRCYFVDPNNVANFETIERLKFNCPNFLTKRAKVNVNLGIVRGNVSTKPGEKLTALPEMKYQPKVGDIMDVQSRASILPGSITVQKGLRVDNNAYDRAYRQYQEELYKWQEESKAELQALAAATSRANSDAAKKRADADAARRKADDAKKAQKIAIDLWNKTRQSRDRARNQWEQLRRLLQSRQSQFQSGWSKFVSFFKPKPRPSKAQQDEISRIQRQAQDAQNQLNRIANDERIRDTARQAATNAAAQANSLAQNTQKMAEDARKAVEAAAVQEKARKLAIEAERIAREKLVKEAQELADNAAREINKLSSVTSKHVNNGLNATANVAKGIGTKAEKTGKDIEKTFNNAGKDLKKLFRLGFENMDVEGFRPPPTRPNRSDNQFQVPNMVTTNHNRVNNTANGTSGFSWDPNQFAVTQSSFQEIENVRFPKDRNYIPNHPGRRELDVTVKLAVDGKRDSRMYIDDRYKNPRFSYEENGMLKVTSLESNVNNAVSFAIWDEDDKGKNKYGLKFGDIYVDCEDGNKRRLNMLSFSPPARNSITPNAFWLHADPKMRCSSEIGNSGTVNDINSIGEQNFLVSPNGYFMLSFQKNETDGLFYLYMRFGKSVKDSKLGRVGETDDTDKYENQGQPILYLRRPISNGLSNSVYQLTTHTTKGIVEARAIPRTFDKMFKSDTFSTSTNNQSYFPDSLNTDSLDVKYKVASGAQTKKECSDLCLGDITCHSFIYDKKKNGSSRCFVDNAGIRNPVVTTIKTSPDIQMSVVGKKQLRISANQYDTGIRDLDNQLVIDKVMPMNAEIKFYDPYIKNDNRYVGNGVLPEYNKLKNEIVSTFREEDNIFGSRPSEAVKEGFDLTDIENQTQKADDAQNAYKDAYEDTNAKLQSYYEKQKDMYGTLDGNKDEDYGRLPQLKVNDSDYLIPSKFNLNDTSSVPTTSIEDARQEDLRQLLLQQNSVYTVGTLTAATFLMTAIVLARE